MAEKNIVLPDLNGGCLCGQVRYQVRGPRRNIIDCHCENCRRTHGHFSAYTSVLKENLVLLKQQSLKWYHDSSPNTYRGFCQKCGSSLFWDARGGNDKMSVSAGSLDSTQGLKTVGHIYMQEAGDYYEVIDGLPQFQTSSHGELESS